MTESLTLEGANEAATERLGQLLANCLLDSGSSLTLGLIGTLGAGKTRFVQSLAAALGADRDTVVSPTFVLCHHYEGRIPIYHLDAYRIGDPEEFLALGVDEYFNGPGVTLVEWSDRVSSILPADCLTLTIAVRSEFARTYLWQARGPCARQILGSLAQAVRQCKGEEFR